MSPEPTSDAECPWMVITTRIKVKGPFRFKTEEAAREFLKAHPAEDGILIYPADHPKSLRRAAHAAEGRTDG